MKKRKMDFSTDFDLTLEAGIALISYLWNENDVAADIKGLILTNSATIENWTVIENKVIFRLKKFVLPNALKTMLNNLVQPMGMEIYKWISLTQFSFQNYSYFPESLNFFWTEKSSLDYIKTTQHIINNTSNKLLCFYLACTFSIHKSIYKLWPEVNKILIEKIILNPSSCMEANPVVYWTFYLYGEVEKLMNIHEYCGLKIPSEFAFFLLQDTKCASTLRYFLEQIEPERRQKFALTALQNIFRSKRRHDGNVLILLFKCLNKPDNDRMQKENSYKVLSSLLEWPCCLLYFKETAYLLLNYLEKPDYLNLFQDIVAYASKCYKSSVFKTLAEEVWHAASMTCKNYVKIKCMSGTFLSRLFLYENVDDIIQMILNDFTPYEKHQIIFYFESINICDFLVKKERWTSLKLFVTSCIPSSDVLEEFLVQYDDFKPCYLCYNKEADLRTSILKRRIREWY